MKLRRNRNRYLVRGGVAVLAVAFFAILSKGDPVAFGRYLFDGGAYLGNSLVKRQVVIDGAAQRRYFSADRAAGDHRRPFPDFAASAAPSPVLPARAGEAERYGAFVARALADPAGGGATERAARLVQLVHRAYAANRREPRKIDDGALGGSNGASEPYVFYLVNAETACGTVGEATVALFRANGFRARLVILSDRTWPLVASHIVAEYFHPEFRKWVLVDPMIGFHGVRGGKALGIADVLDDPALRDELSDRHGTPDRYYNENTVAWIDQRGPVRTKYYYTALEKNRRELDNRLR